MSTGLCYLCVRTKDLFLQRDHTYFTYPLCLSALQCDVQTRNNEGSANELLQAFMDWAKRSKWEGTLQSNL